MDITMMGMDIIMAPGVAIGPDLVIIMASGLMMDRPTALGGDDVTFTATDIIFITIATTAAGKRLFCSKRPKS
jgi:hypothetical protein